MKAVDGLNWRWRFELSAAKVWHCLRRLELEDVEWVEGEAAARPQLRQKCTQFLCAIRVDQGLVPPSRRRDLSPDPLVP